MATANQGERKTKGRQKIEIKKIENKSRLHVTFLKRRKGIFKKAQELHLRTGAEIAVFVRSPGNKIFAFGSPSPDSVIHHYINGPNSPLGTNGEVALDLMAPITEEDGATGEEFGGSTLDLLHGFDTGPITQEGGGGGMGDFGGNNNDFDLLHGLDNWPITGEEGGGGIGEFGGSTLDLLHGFDSWPITEEGGGGICAFGGSNKDVVLDLHCGLGSLPITEEGEGSMGTFGASNNDVALDLLCGLDSGPNTQEQETATNVDDCMYLLDSSLLL